ncbi:MAG: DUF177 domain-containing protein [Anaerolinea sp.]|nr:DUF177 domain-containing protein [Anaerolinea sp.]
MIEERTQWNVAQLLKEPIGATRSFDVLATVLQEDADIQQATPLAGRIVMLRTSQGVLVEGDLDGAAVVECSRCLRPVTVPVSVALEEEFKPTVDVVRGAYLHVDEEDAALLIDEHHILDLTEVLRQAILLETPMQVLCRPDCAGFCQTCGQDLNQGPCDCLPADTDPRWDQLSALLEDIKL